MTESPASFLIPMAKKDSDDGHGGDKRSGGGGLCHADGMFAIGQSLRIRLSGLAFRGFGLRP